MELEEAIKILNEIKYLEIRPEYKVQAIDIVLNELDNADKRIKMLIDLLNSEGCLNFDNYEEKIKYIDKLIELENKE